MNEEKIYDPSENVDEVISEVLTDSQAIVIIPRLSTK